MSLLSKIALSLREVASSLHRLVDDSTPDKRQRSQACGTALVGFNADTGVATFRTRCRGSDNTWDQEVGFTAGKKGGWETLQMLMAEMGKEAQEDDEEDEDVEEEVADEEEAEEIEDVEEEIEEEVEVPTMTFESLLDFLQKNNLRFRAKVRCNCPSFSYDGYAYIAYKLGYGWPPKVDAPPEVRNPHLMGRLCKHLIQVSNRFFV